MLTGLIEWAAQLAAWQQLSLLMAVAYASGSVLGAVWICQRLGLADPRLAGSFNSWQPQDMLFDSVEGLWKVEQEVSPGRHQFKFVVDGLWVHDEDQVGRHLKAKLVLGRCCTEIG